MRIMIELTDPTYMRLRARAAERGVRGFSAIVEEALDCYLGQDNEDVRSALLEAEGAWSDRDVAEWERIRKGT